MHVPVVTSNLMQLANSLMKESERDSHWDTNRKQTCSFQANQAE